MTAMVDETSGLVAIVERQRERMRSERTRSRVARMKRFELRSSNLVVSYMQVAFPPAACPQWVDLEFPASPASLAKFTCSARQQSWFCDKIWHFVMQSALSVYVPDHIGMGVHTAMNVVQ
jgi:hypothetical protein